jgi:hypothetical protein
MSLCLLCGARFKKFSLRKFPEGALSADEHAQDVQIRAAEGPRQRPRSSKTLIRCGLSRIGHWLRGRKKAPIHNVFSRFLISSTSFSRLLR